MSRTPEEVAHIIHDIYEDEAGGNYEPYRLTKAQLRDIADIARLEDSTIQKIMDILLSEYHLYMPWDSANDQFGVFNVRIGLGLRRLPEAYLHQYLRLAGPRDNQG